MRDAVDGDGALLHRLEQRRLGAGRCPVDLVSEHHGGEHRPGVELEGRGPRMDTETPVTSLGSTSVVN
jgi:hypothetical protein